MNYFAHAVRHLDRPYFVAGTALPDWLSVVERKVRFRERFARPLADGSGSPAAEIAAGVLQHHHDDHWFHGTQAFHEVSGRLTVRFRELLPGPFDHRPSFLGHIVTELLLDAELISRFPERIDAYYRLFDQIDPRLVQQTVQAAVPHVNTLPVDSMFGRLGEFIPLFCRERFLYDYVDPERLVVRLNQVLRRVKLPPLPETAVTLLAEARRVVSPRVQDLLLHFDHPFRAIVA
jgi:hypothetical protein